MARIVFLSNYNTKGQRKEKNDKIFPIKFFADFLVHVKLGLC